MMKCDESESRHETDALSSEIEISPIWMCFTCYKRTLSVQLSRQVAGWFSERHQRGQRRSHPSDSWSCPPGFQFAHFKVSFKLTGLLEHF